MRIEQVAAQLYTVRQHMKSPEETAATLKRVREIGYQAVQLASMGDLSEAEIARMLKEAGLTCFSSHENPERLLDEPAAVVKRMEQLGCRFPVLPHPGRGFSSADEVRAYAARLNAAGRVFHEAGMTLCYHNHSMEFRRYDDRLMLEILYGETDPQYVQAELDTFWVQHGGGDAEDWCRQLKGRLPLLHLKDYAMGDDSKPTFAEIGNGNLNWKKIIAAAEESGCRWFTVEQDICPGDPLDSLRTSFEYIRQHLAS